MDSKTNIYGTVESINGDIAEVKFDQLMPKLNDVLTSEKTPSVILQIYTAAGRGSYYCMILRGKEELTRGERLIVSTDSMSIPVGDAIMGRVMNLFGDPIDGKGPIEVKEKRPIFRESPHYSKVSTKKEIWETGIKAIDFFAPLVKGGKIGLFGGAGVGKTILLSEILHNIFML